MRIRSIKPEFFTDRITGRWSADLKMFYVGLWSYADDEGRFEWEPDLIRCALYPFDPSANVRGWLEELIAAKRVVKYEIGGVIYGAVVAFSAHQHPKTRIPSRLPAPPTQCASESHRMGVPSTLDVNGRGAGEEGRGEERRGSERAADAASLLGQETTETPLVLWLREEFPIFSNPSALEEAWVKQFPGLDLLAEAMSAKAKQDNRRRGIGEPLGWLEACFRRADVNRRVGDAKLADAIEGKDRREPERPRSRRMLGLDPEGKPIWADGEAA